MAFQSILSGNQVREHPEEHASTMPSFFIDLNLDQVIDAITATKPEYNLKPFFYTPLHDTVTIQYRHEVFLDLENQRIADIIREFARRMRLNREQHAQIEKLHYPLQKQFWFLDAVEIYCEALHELEQKLGYGNPKSKGLRSFLEYLRNYLASEPFTAVEAAVKGLKYDLAGIKYCMVIKDNSVQVRKAGTEEDYSSEVEETFSKFKDGAVKDYTVKYPDHPDMNHVEAKVLEFVSQLFPEIYTGMDLFCTGNIAYMDPMIRDFDREIQFYIAYLEFIETFRSNGLAFCYPQMSEDSREISDKETYDLALANKYRNQLTSILTNDFYLRDKERIIVVSGPNQGGKTTFARMFGQLHYLASLGCPVPGKEARLFLSDNLFTHFEKEENIQDLRGKLEDDLIRINDILDRATSKSIIIINEILISTTLKDAVFLSKKIMDRLIHLDLLCVWVTFIEELSTFDKKTISMVSTIVPENPVQRTFKIVRMPANGLSFARAIAEKHHLTYESLKKRIGS